MQDQVFNNVARRSGMDDGSFAKLFGGQQAAVTAEKIQLVSDVIVALEGAYNTTGISQWFNRSRAQLDGHIPRELLEQPWAATDKAPQKILALARSLRA